MARSTGSLRLIVANVVVIPLTLVLIGLKLSGVIAWSWWWVLAPVWIQGLLAVVAVALVFAVLLITAMRKGR